MGRAVEIYKLNEGDAKTRLYDNLISTNRHKKSFKTFINERHLSEEKDDVFENICNKVKSDINTILPWELFQIVLWFSGRINLNKSKEETDVLYNQNGLCLLFELYGTSSSAFMFQFGTFLDHFATKEGVSEGKLGYNVKTPFFIKFLDYMILLTRALLEEKFNNHTYNFTIDEIEEIFKIEEVYKNEQKLFEVIRSETKILKRCWKDYCRRDNEKYSRITPETQTVFETANFFGKCIEAKKTISSINTNILILDSF